MIRPLSRLFVAAAAFAAGFAVAGPTFLAPEGQATESITFGPLDSTAALPEVDDSGRIRVGPVRSLSKAARIAAWTATAGGYVTRIEMTSMGATGLRAHLELGTMPGEMQVRVRGDDDVIETMTVDPLLGTEAWTPYTAGEKQSIEIFSRVAPAEDAIRVAGVLHLTQSPLAKAAASCTLSTLCPSGDVTLDAAIAERKKSVFKIQFVEAGSGFVCTANLIDTPRRPAAYALTANHCINSTATAASITAFWFYETASCASTAAGTGLVQVAGGAQLTFTNYNADATLLLMNQAPPTGALYSPVNAGLMASGQSFVSLSHPHGDTARWATGIIGTPALARDNSRPYDMYNVTFNRGIIEPGSSGSGIFSLNAGHLELRGVLSQAASTLSCATPTLPALYARLEAFYPEIAQYIGATTVPADDAPNRPQDVPATPDVPLNLRGNTLAIDNRRIDYPGDVDIYRFSTTATTYVSAWTEGAQDTVGSILDAAGVVVNSGDGATDAPAANDDGDWTATTNNNFGITTKLGAGTYFLHVAHWLPSGTGVYNVRLRADAVDANYTDLWSTATEQGWGLNVNHQGNTLFATLYTYDGNGNPIWLFMSGGDKQADGAYAGTLYRATGTAFTAATWSPVTSTAVGQMRIAFASTGAGTVQYTYNGSTVTKAITRYAFRAAPTCTWSAFDRAQASNYQDLWWNPAEPGWGLSIAHQGTVMFASLYVYGADGQPTWYVMSEGNKTLSGNWTGTLYRTRGPSFDASPWTAATLTQVGNMNMTFANGNAMTLTYTVNGATVTKSLQRNVFGALKTECAS